MKHEPKTVAAGGAHFHHVGFAFGHFLHDDAGMLLIDVDDDFLDRLEKRLTVVGFLENPLWAATPPSSKPSRRMVSIRIANCSSPRPETMKESAFGESSIRSATLP